MTLILIEPIVCNYEVEGRRGGEHEIDATSPMLVNLMRAYAANDDKTVIQFWKNSREYNGKINARAPLLEYVSINLPFAIFTDALHHALENGMFIPDFTHKGLQELRKIYSAREDAPKPPERKSWNDVHISKPLRFKA